MNFSSLKFSCGNLSRSFAVFCLFLKFSFSLLSLSILDIDNADFLRVAFLSLIFIILAGFAAYQAYNNFYAIFESIPQFLSTVL